MFINVLCSNRFNAVIQCEKSQIRVLKPLWRKKYSEQITVEGWEFISMPVVLENPLYSDLPK
jgi:hypothetical protein